MTNVVQIDKSRGFTRMDNTLMDALMQIDLPARELKVALFIAKKTLNFNITTARIKADDIAKATNIRPDVASKAISHLLRRRVIFREGGSRGDIGLCDPKEWVFVERLSQTKTSDSDQQDRIGQSTSQTKTSVSILYSKKQEPLVTLPSEEITPPQDPSSPPKPDRKAPFGLTNLLADNPHEVSEQVLTDWVALRKAKKASLTATVWKSLNTELTRCKELGIAAETAMIEAISAGWHGFKAEWIAKRLSETLSAAKPAMSRHHGFAERDYTEGLFEREDGTHGF